MEVKSTHRHVYTVVCFKITAYDANVSIKQRLHTIFQHSVENSTDMHFSLALLTKAYVPLIDIFLTVV